MNTAGMILIAGAVLLEVIADVIFKYWSISSKGFLITVGIIVYSIGTVMWAYSLKFGDLSKLVTVFTVLNLVAVVLVGFFLFKEEVSLINMIGILLGVISVILIQV